MKRTKDHDQPPEGRSFSPWIWLVMAGLLAAGVRQMRQPVAMRNDDTRPLAVSRGARPAELPDVNNRQKWLHHAASFTDSMAEPAADPLTRLLQALQGEGDPLKREQLFADFLAGLKGGDMAAMLARLQDARPADLAGDLSRRVVRLWADGNPGAVAAWINQQPAGEQRQLAADNLALIWANSQLANAISWGQSLPDADERNRVLTAVAN